MEVKLKHDAYSWHWPLCAILILGGLLCIVIGETGTVADQEGVLHEVGLLLPMGWGILSTGVIAFAILSFYHRRRRR